MKLYTVVAYRTRSLCRAYAVHQQFNDPMTWGPYKTLRYAKKIRAKLNKERVVVWLRYGEQSVDVGPAFRNVTIVESEK